jgi:hypothetical protein
MMDAEHNNCSYAILLWQHCSEGIHFAPFTAHKALLPTPEKIGGISVPHLICLNFVNNTELTQSVPHMVTMNLSV